MFKFLAFSGDLGCSSGPALVGFVSAALGDNLKKGLLSAVLFQIFLIVGLVLCRLVIKESQSN